MPPTSYDGGIMMGDVCVSICLSVCLSVVCLDLTREQKALGSPKLAGWKPVTG